MSKYKVLLVLSPEVESKLRKFHGIGVPVPHLALVFNLTTTWLYYHLKSDKEPRNWNLYDLGKLFSDLRGTEQQDQYDRNLAHLLESELRTALDLSKDYFPSSKYPPKAGFNELLWQLFGYPEKHILSMAISMFENREKLAPNCQTVSGFRQELRLRLFKEIQDTNPQLFFSKEEAGQVLRLLQGVLPERNFFILCKRLGLGCPAAKVAEIPKRSGWKWDKPTLPELHATIRESLETIRKSPSFHKLAALNEAKIMAGGQASAATSTS